jgi:Chromo (CHRromatin Organisation MOdifier) domain
VRRRHHDLEIGDSVFCSDACYLARSVSEFELPAAGPYPVPRVDGSNVEIRTREVPQRLHLDRVVRCPTTLPSGVSWTPQRKEPPKSKRVKISREDDDTYVIDQLVAHARDEEDSYWLIRVRWAAYSADEDTWEPAKELPEDMVRRYERREKLPEGLLTCAEPPVIDQRQFSYQKSLKKRV